MAGTYQDRVQDYLGTLTDTTALSDQLSAGARKMIDLIPIGELEKFVSPLTDSGSGVSVTSYRFLRYSSAFSSPSEGAQEAKSLSDVRS